MGCLWGFWGGFRRLIEVFFWGGLHEGNEVLRLE